MTDRAARAWLLSCNPNTWDVARWHAEGPDAEPLTEWTVRHHKVDIRAGDDFALWVSGPRRGVQAIGTITEEAYGPLVPRGRYWREPPSVPRWMVGVRVTRQFVEEPILGADLRMDPGFADALIFRLPRAANPVALEDEEWAAIMAAVGARGPETSRPGSG